MGFFIIFIIIFIIFFLWFFDVFGLTSEKIKEQYERDEDRRKSRQQKENKIIEKINKELTELTDSTFVWDSISRFVVAIAFDKTEMKLIVISKNKRLFTFNKGDILKCELRTNSKTISTGVTTKKGTIPRAVIGGVIAGGAGAIVGGMSTKEKHSTTTRTVSSYYIDFYTSNPDLPFVTLTGLENNLKKWYGFILSFIEIEKSNSNSQVGSVADEIIKLKELLDSEVITQIEFDNEKGEILKRS